MTSTIHIRRADLHNSVEDAQAIVKLLNEMALIPVISGRPLPDDVQQRIVPGLAAHPTSAVWLAWDGEVAVGVLVAIGGYSTFYAAPTLNIHDLCITSTHQGRGIGTSLLMAAEEYAKCNGCAKLTLETRRDNPSARRLYKKLGYAADHEDDETFFWEKKI